jgi:hypothetical protein
VEIRVAGTGEKPKASWAKREIFNKQPAVKQGDML